MLRSIAFHNVKNRVSIYASYEARLTASSVTAFMSAVRRGGKLPRCTGTAASDGVIGMPGNEERNEKKKKEKRKARKTPRHSGRRRAGEKKSGGYSYGLKCQSDYERKPANCGVQVSYASEAWRKGSSLITTGRTFSLSYVQEKKNTSEQRILIWYYYLQGGSRYQRQI